MAIRLDANGAWDHDQAVATLRALQPSGIELCEEPVHGLAELAALRAETEVPLALDESALEPGALDGAFGDLVCLKVSRCGGIAGTLAAATTGPGRRLRGLPRLDARRTARDRRRAALRCRDPTSPRLRPGHARIVRRRA